MEAQPTLAFDILKQIDEIRRYYDACGTSSGSALRISRTMLSFALGCHGPEAVEPLLEELQRQGQLTAIVGEDLVFAPVGTMASR